VQTTTDIGSFLSTLLVLRYFTVTQWALCLASLWGQANQARRPTSSLSLLQPLPLLNCKSNLSSHFFVFYCGVLADITPPVALAAYAAAGIAGSNPFETCNTAFRLGIASLGVAFSESLLATLETWERRWVALVSFLFIAPDLGPMVIGLALIGLILLIQVSRAKQNAPT